MLVDNPYSFLIYFFLWFVGVVIFANIIALVINTILRVKIAKYNQAVKARLPKI